jgi:hypothetical protein
VAVIFLYTSYSACIVVLLQSSTTSIRTLNDLLHSGLTLGAHDVVFNRYFFKVGHMATVFLFVALCSLGMQYQLFRENTASVTREHKISVFDFFYSIYFLLFALFNMKCRHSSLVSHPLRCH